MRGESAGAKPTNQLLGRCVRAGLQRAGLSSDPQGAEVAVTFFVGKGVVTRARPRGHFHHLGQAPRGRSR